MSVGDVEDIYELSPLQQGMLLHSLYGGDADTYLAQRNYAISGPLDANVLERAMRRLTEAHTTLRTSFHWEGLDKPLQVVHRQAPFAIGRHDWSDLDPDQQRARFDQLAAAERAAGFDLERPPLQRMQLVRFGEARHGLIWTHHLLLLDGWSAPIVVNDLAQLYRGLVMGGPPPPPAPPYRSYIAWLQGQDLDAARDFWAKALAGRAHASPFGPLLPSDRDARPGPVHDITVSFPPALETRLRAVATRHQVTLNTVLQAAWALVLQRYTGDTEVAFGVVSSGRPAELPGVDRMVGVFTNTLPVAVAVPDDGELGPWLREVQARCTAVRRYEHSPLAEVRKWARVPASQPLFHSVMVVDNYPLTVRFGELDRWLSLRSMDVFEKTSEPLTLLVTPEPQSTIQLLYHRDRFAPGAVDELMEYFQAVLAGIPDADRIAAVARAAAPAAAGRGRGDVVRYADADRTLPELVERRVDADPDAVAVVADGGVLTYGELHRRASAVAAAVRRSGAGPGRVVGVCAERSLELVTGVLGVLYAGAAYLPLEPSLPAARLAYLVSDAGASLVLAQRGVADLAQAAGARHVVTLEEIPAVSGARSSVTGADAAYVIYTSGSTGRPKGVVVTHQAIVNRLLWMQDTFRLTPADRVLQKTPFGFDVSVWELFWPLLTGAAMVLARPDGHQDPGYLVETIARHNVTTAHFVPSMLQLFLEEPVTGRIPALRRVVCSGEALGHGLAERCRSLLPGVELHNLYGPTEAAVDVTWWDCARPAPPGVVPIGHPIANTQAHVLDRRLLPAPDGVPGELFLGGVQLARGYLNRPGLTAERFVAHPLAGPGGRLYRTGDQVRRLSDGAIEFLGRLDDQVKIRGYRIELPEIEQVLLEHSGVRQAAVIARDGPDGPQLAGYVTGAAGLDAEELREHLRLRLPRYMVPAKLGILPALPLTHNGKLDRAALPDLAPAAADGATSTAPGTPEEAAVAAVYRDVLGLTELDVTVSFFDLGGDSFDAVRAIRRIEGATVGLLAAHPSVRELAAALCSADQPAGILLPLNRPHEAAHTLVCVPFGGGSAISYQPLARALSEGTALHAVSLPGHEVGEASELRPLEEVAEAAVQAALVLGNGPLSVYGHCAGVALAVDLVRGLEAAGRTVERLYLGASFPFYEPGPVGRVMQRLTSTGRVTAATVGNLPPRPGPAADLAELEYLQAIGGFQGLIDEEAVGFVMRAFRHDVAEARRYFSKRWSRRSDTRPLAAPITFVAGTDDPLTPRYERRARMWQRFSSAVELATVPGGGHYFHQQQPEILAKLIESGR